MAIEWDVKLRWEKLPGGKNSPPFNEEEGNTPENKKYWIDSNNVYPTKEKKEQNNDGN